MTRAIQALTLIAVAVVALTGGVVLGQATTEPAGATSVVVVPDACEDALTAAEDVFATVGDVLGETWPLAVESAYYRDVAGMEQATREMDDLGTELARSPYRALADECLAAGGEVR